MPINNSEFIYYLQTFSANQNGEGKTMGGQKVAAKRDRRKQATPVRRGGVLKNLLVPKLPFLKLVKQIATHVGSNSMQGFRYITKGFI